MGVRVLSTVAVGDRRIEYVGVADGVPRSDLVGVNRVDSVPEGLCENDIELLSLPDTETEMFPVWLFDCSIEAEFVAVTELDMLAEIETFDEFDELKVTEGESVTLADCVCVVDAVSDVLEEGVSEAVRTYSNGTWFDAT